MKTQTRSRSRSAFAMVSGLALAITACTGLAQVAPATAQTGATTPVVDFDAAMRGLKFDPATVDANLSGGSKGDGMLDADQMALAAAVLAKPGLDLGSKGGVSNKLVRAAYDQAMASAQADLAKLNATYPTAPAVVAGYALLGADGRQSMGAMTAAFGAPLKGDYAKAEAQGRFFSATGDADGDGVSNGAEYAATIGKGRAAFITAALDPQVKPAAQAAQQAKVPAIAPGKKVVGVVLYPGFEVLDVFGPIEMWAYVPDFQVITIAQTAGPVKSAQQGIAAVADYSFETAPKLDILMVPGGIGTQAELGNEVLLNYLREQDKTTQLTTSVCTGSALLAKAGLLKGRKATSNKNFFSLAVDQDPSVDWQGKARWVEDGKYITSSGVSAGTDMALGLIARLKGKTQAAMLARSLEYQWNDDPLNDPFAIQVPARAAN
jgi:putative intracellular protease/amidase